MGYQGGRLFTVFKNAHTVGVQSKAHAQSIAQGHIGDNICKKTKGSIQQQILEQKTLILL
jgi:hypothetical protein